MQAVYYAARANLRRLMILHPNWTRGQDARLLRKADGTAFFLVVPAATPDGSQLLRTVRS